MALKDLNLLETSKLENIKFCFRNLGACEINALCSQTSDITRYKEQNLNRVMERENWLYSTKRLQDLENTIERTPLRDVP